MRGIWKSALAGALGLFSASCSGGATSSPAGGDLDASVQRDLTQQRRHQARAILPHQAGPLDVVWGGESEVTSDDGAAGDLFGSSVALSGALGLVGAPGHGAAVGEAYVLSEDAEGNWSLAADLKATGGFVADELGASVAIDGAIAVVGAPRHTEGLKAGSGAAYVFSNASGAWLQVAELSASDGEAGDAFGSSVAISGTTLIVGAPFHAYGGTDLQGGEAYVFSNASGSWKEVTPLNGADEKALDLFGCSVAISGATALVGAYGHGGSAGSAYVFTQGSGASWSAGPELTATGGAAGDAFGRSVAVNGATAVVGAPQHAPAGAAYVFALGGSTPAQTELTTTGGVTGDSVGSSVGVSGATVVVGAPGRTVGTNTGEGAVYAYVLIAGTWSFQEQITSSDGAAGDGFGHAVAQDGDNTISGALDHAGGGNPDQGEAYVYSSTYDGPTDCIIGGSLVDAGASNPASVCQVCAPSTAGNAWANLPNGTTCATNEICVDGACLGDCYIASSSYSPGELNPVNSCQVCTPAFSATAWSTEPNGSACFDNACTLGATCQAGACVGSTPVVCVARDECHLAGTCDPVAGCSNPNAPNGTACDTTGQCSDGTCVGGIVVDSGTSTSDAGGSSSSTDAGSSANDGSVSEDDGGLASLDGGSGQTGHDASSTSSDGGVIATDGGPSTGDGGVSVDDGGSLPSDADGGGSVSDDGGTLADAAPASGAGDEAGVGQSSAGTPAGCGCVIAGGGGPESSGLVLGMLGLVSLVQRRRRR